LGFPEPVRHIEPGAIDQDVNPAVPSEYGLRDPADGVGVADVEFLDFRPAAGRLDSIGMRLQQLAPPAGHHDRGAGLRQRFGCSQPDAGPCAGDPGDLIFQ
jgi:hypothetical protein